MSKPALKIIAAPSPFVTRGQASLANGCGQEFCHHTYMATLQPEGDEAREKHIEQARHELERAAKFLGMKVVDWSDE